MKFTTAFTIAVLATPWLQAGAQAPVAERPSNWSLSVGADPTHFDLRTRDPGVNARFVGALSHSWATRFEKLRLKAELMAGLDAPRGFRDTDGTLCGGCDVDARRGFASVGVGATLQLLRTSRLKPYLTVGTGVYHNSFSARSPLECKDFSCTTGGRPFYLRQSSSTSLGLNGGVGVSFRLRGREFFVQQSAHASEFRGGHTVFPLSLGIKF